MTTQNRKNYLEKITKNTKIWKPNLNIVLPICGRDIPDFKEWVNWNGYSESHRGFDFTAYINNNKCVLGLPSITLVRAVADGIVRQVSQGLAEGDGYATFINIEHGKKDSGMFSSYHHIDPLVEYGQPVKKGDRIATLYKDSGYKKGRLVHLHFELTHGWDVKNRCDVNPADIYNNIAKFIAKPQGSKNFKIFGLKKQPRIHIANFKILRVNEDL